MKSIIFTFVTIFIGISIAVPIKDHDDLVLRVNELRRLNPYQDDLRFYIRNLDSIGGGNLLRSLNSVIDRSSSSSSSLSKDGFYGKNAIEMNNGNYGDGENEEHVYGKFVQNNHGIANNVPHREKRAIDLDRNPTLYSYYSGLLNNINDKRNPALATDNERKLEKIILLQDSFEPYDYASSSRLVEEPLGKRNFDEIDRALIGGLKKRLSTYKLPRLYNSYDNNSPIDVSSKRNFDEIDRAGFTTLKRNGFDEIDRAGFVSLKRNLLNLANSPDRYPSLSSSASRSAILNGYSMEKHD